MAVRHGLTSTEAGFAPWDLGIIADPYPVYTRLREHAPVVHDEPTDHWLVSRHADVSALLRDRRLGRTYLHVASPEETGRPQEPAWHEPFWHLIRSGILDMEPLDHTRVRTLVSKAFTPRVVESLRTPIQAIVDALVERGRGRGRVRPDPFDRGTAPGGGHRRTPRHPAGRSSSLAPLVGGDLPDVRTEPFRRTTRVGR